MEDIEEHSEDDEPEMSSTVKYEKKYISEHPYCTNWPTSREEKNENI